MKKAKIKVRVRWSLIALGCGLGMSVGFHSTQAWELLPAQPPIPSNNPQSKAKIELGKKLYFEKRLSKTNEVSCNSCHDVMGNGSDAGPVSSGVKGQKGGRRSPTVWNSAFNTVQFWDGRAKSLEDQAKGPMVNPVEMGMDNHELVIERLSKIEAYKKEFKKAFPDQPTINIEQVAQAIAAYERTLITPNSPYDRFLKGNKKALSPSAKRGMELAKTVGCVACHSGPHFSGPQLKTGFYMKFPMIPGSEYEKKYEITKDLGRYEVTKNEADKNFWRVPSWRNVDLRAPYFHNGRVQTLDEAVRVMGKTQLGKDLTDQEVGDLVSFLKSLTGQRPRQTEPTLPQ
jgi:cytochrome c peroxidase